MLSFFKITPLLNVIVCIGCFVFLLKEKKLKVLLLFLISAFFSSASYFMWRLSDNAVSALFWCRMLMAGAIFIPVTFLHFIIKFLDIIGTFVGVLGGATNYFLWYNIHILPYGNVLVPIFAFTISYAVIQYNLVDISLAFRKMLKNFFVFLFLAGSITSIILSFFYKNYYIAALSILALAFLFYFKNAIDSFLYNFFLGRHARIWAKLKKEVEIKSNIFDFNKVVSILVDDISKHLNLSFAAYYRFDKERKKFLPIKVNSVGKDHFQNPIPREFKFIDKILETKTFIYIENLRKNDEDYPVVFELEKFVFDMVYPFFMGDEIVGFLVYGVKLNERVFHREDLEILSEIISTANIQMLNIDKVNEISIKTSEEILEIYKNKYQVQLLEQIRIIGENRDFDSLCINSTKLLSRFLKGSVIDIYLYDKDSNQYVCKTDEKLS